MQHHRPTVDAVSTSATDALNSAWGLLPEALQRFVIAGARIAFTLVAARLLLRLVPALERVVVRRAARAATLRANATESMIDQERRVATLVKIVGSVTRVIVGSVALVIVLSAVGIDIAPLLAGAGIAGVAVGFGAQSVVKDFFSGFFIVLENHYDVGDTVTINAVTGTVEEMTMRVTVIRDTAGALHYIPNGTISTATNRTAGWSYASIDLSTPVSVPAGDVRRVLDQIVADEGSDPALAGKLVGSITVEGPLEFVGDRVTWRLKAQARPGVVHAVRERLISALQKRVPVDEAGALRWEKALSP